MTKAELVFIPIPAAGHLHSTLEIAKLLLARNEHISITIFIIKRPTTNNIAIDQSLGDPTLSKRIRFIDLPFDEKFLEKNPSRFFLSLIESHKANVKEIVSKLFRSELDHPDSPKLAGFVLDMVCTSMIDVANELGVPSYMYFTSGASYFSLALHMGSNEKDFDVMRIGSDTNFEIAGFVNPVPTSVLPRSALNEDMSSIFFEIVRRYNEFKGIMINSFEELESYAFESLSDNNKYPVLYPVGPILNLKNSSQDEDLQKCSEIMTWLDDQPPCSVVFLCFGSMGAFSETQIKEIAFALEKSGHRFLWSIRRQPLPGQPARVLTDYENPEEVLPEGFLARTAEIGKIIRWAPQADILAHPSVGGFVSHCGWNSILESIWFGVPIATWPIYAEQQVNAFTMVKELGLGVDIKMDYWQDPKNEIIVSADLIEGGIRGVMELDSEIRKKTKEICVKSKKALVNGGSSYCSLGNFIEDVIRNMS